MKQLQGTLAKELGLRHVTAAVGLAQRYLLGSD